MNRSCKVALFFLAILVTSAADAGFKSKPFIPPPGEPIKTIGLLKIGEPRGYFLGEGGGPGAATQVFGLGGLFYEQFKKPKHPEYASAGFHFGAEAERVLTEDLKAAGFNVIVVPVERDKPYQLLDDYNALSVPNVDAYLDVAPGGVGYRKGTFGHGVGPVVGIFVQLVSARSKKILYAESLEYAWHKATVGNAGIDIVAPDNYMFEDTDALERDLLSGAGNSRALAQLSEGIDVAMGKIVSELGAHPATGPYIAEATPADTPLSPEDALRALFADSTSTGTTSSRKSGWMYTRSDNTTLGRRSNGDMDAGTWRISKEGWFCRTWNRWADGKEGCWQVEPEKKNKYKFTPKAGVADPYVMKILQGHDGLQYRRYH